MEKINNYYDLLQALIKENLDNKKIKQHREFLFHPIAQERGRRLDKFWAKSNEINSIQRRFDDAEKIYGEYEARINKILKENPYKTEVHDCLKNFAYPVVTSTDIVNLLQSKTGKKWTSAIAFHKDHFPTAYPIISFRSEDGECLSIRPVHDEDAVKKDAFGAARMEDKYLCDGYINWFTVLQCPSFYDGARAYENPNLVATIWVIPEKIEKILIDQLRATPIKHAEHNNTQISIISDKKQQPVCHESNTTTQKETKAK